MNLTELVARAEQIAIGKATDPNLSPVIDGTMTAEALAYRAIRYALVMRLRSGRAELQNAVAEISLTIAGGKAALPDGVLREFADTWYLPAVPRSSYIPFVDYVRDSSVRFTGLLKYFSQAHGFLYYGTDGALLLHAPAVPEIPANVDDDLDLPDAALQDAILLVAAVMTGEMPISQLTRDEF